MLVSPYLLFYRLDNFQKAFSQLKKCLFWQLLRMLSLALGLNHKSSDLAFIRNPMLLIVCNLARRELNSSICYDRNKCTTNQKLIHFVLSGPDMAPALQFSKFL